MGDLADQWDTPEALRRRPDYAQLWGMKVMSGKWAPITDAYWDDCVIAVPFTTRRFYR